MDSSCNSCGCGCGSDNVDYSQVTPATGLDADDKKLPESLANQMPTADSPARDTSIRSDPDKTIPGAEAATAMDEAAEGAIKKKA